MNRIASLIETVGGDADALRLISHDGPELLRYATLVNARRGVDALSVVGAVYEWQDAPLIFLIDADDLANEGQIHRARRLLAMRGDAPYLGVISPGKLDVYRVALDRKTLGQARVKLAHRQGEAGSVLSTLANQRPDVSTSQRGWISNVVLSLLTGSIRRLVGKCEISGDDAISLVGRALFTRFLADRGLLPISLVSAVGEARLFDNRQSAAATSEWLDATFNGDLLPLSPGLFNTLPDEAFHVLGDVLRRAPDSQLFLGWEERWDHLDFAHIPVGVLSQAYELYLRDHAPAQQRREGGYYTPRPIADLMVRTSFRALRRDGRSKFARVLDPAAGAGVFLLTAFRELVAERWHTDGVRPDTETLRAILYDQVTGFDINEAALRFAALGLYLMSIELDPEPRPVDKLRFENMRGRVLHLLVSDSPRSSGDGSFLGSLGPLVGQKHVGHYDLVIGNPPWSSGTKLPDWSLVREAVARIASTRVAGVPPPPLPNEGLDLPFVWRAMEWARPGGQIAFALHARLLFQQGDGMAEARQALFGALDVTGLINGVELRQTKVWPEISAPFCLLLATNRAAGPGSGFRFVSPRLEPALNDAGAMRVDATNGDLINSSRLAETPEILKILFRGTEADLGIVERLRAREFPTLDAYWRQAFGVARGRPSGSGNGYQRLRPSSRVRQQGDGLPGVDASYLKDLPEISAESLSDFNINTRRLPPFARARIHDPRSRALFTAPIAIVHKSPPASAGRIAVGVTANDVIFNETFYGYSTAGHPEPLALAKYLTLILGSKFALWFCLVTSGEFGFEREVVEKATLDRIPIPRFECLAAGERQCLEELTAQLEDDPGDWKAADAWVARLYGLGAFDLEVIEDTLTYNLPFADNRSIAAGPPSPWQLSDFVDVLNDELASSAKRFGGAATAELKEWPSFDQSWASVSIMTHNGPAQTPSADDWAGLARTADRFAASEVTVRLGGEGLLIGRLAQARYWSRTQARLLARRTLWNHLDLFRGQSA